MYKSTLVDKLQFEYIVKEILQIKVVGIETIKSIMNQLSTETLETLLKSVVLSHSYKLALLFVNVEKKSNLLASSPTGTGNENNVFSDFNSKHHEI